MAKYKRKPTLIEAQQYKRGMEDGFAAFKIFTEEFLGYFEKGQPYPKSNLKPYIQTLTGKMIFEEDAYIVTESNGKRRIISKDVFEEKYQLVEQQE